MATLLNSLFFVFKISFLLKYCVKYYADIEKWCSVIYCNWRASLDIANMLAVTSVLPNTSQLAERTLGQPARHSIGCGHRLPGQEGYSNEPKTCHCGIMPTKQYLLICPMTGTVFSTQDLTTANGIAIGGSRNWEGTI